MKKTLALCLALAALLSLAACGTGEIYLHDPAVTAQPAVTARPVEPEPPYVMDAAETLGLPVILNIRTVLENYEAPDESGRIILSYGYNDVDVYLEGRTAAAEAINQVLDLQDELFYTGTETGNGINVMLEQALDNFALTQHTGVSTNLEFSCMRSAIVDRGDSRVLSLRYRINSYTGGAHGSYQDRAFVFDTATGEHLTLDTLFTDRAAFEQAMLNRMQELIETDVRYRGIQEYMLNFRPGDDQTEALRALLREGSWLLSDEGFTVFSDIGELGGYASGIYRFTLRYDELEGLLREEYLPVERPESGELMILELDDANAASVHLIDKVTVSDTGAEFRIFAQGTLYGITIESVSYVSDDVGFYQTDSHWYCSYLSNAGVQVQTDIPDGMPNLMLRYFDAAGTQYRYLVTQSGEDGSIILLPAEHVTAVG